MERKQEEFFDARGFFDLLGNSLRKVLLDHEALTGVLVARIHVRDGEPWAGSVRFDDEAKRATASLQSPPAPTDGDQMQLLPEDDRGALVARCETAWMGSDSRAQGSPRDALRNGRGARCAEARRWISRSPIRSPRPQRRRRAGSCPWIFNSAIASLTRPASMRSSAGRTRRRPARMPTSASRESGPRSL